MREVGGLWVWADRASCCLMLGNEAAAEAATRTALAHEHPLDLAAMPPEPLSDQVSSQFPDLFSDLGCFGLPDGPVVALRVALDPGLDRDAASIGALLSGLKTSRAPDVRLDYAADPDGRRMWRDGQLVAEGALRGEGAARGFNLIFEFLLDLLAHQPLAAILHGSGLVWRGHHLVFSGPSGAGKSTLTALLAARGAQYLGDDSVALLHPDCRIFPLPLTPTIKEGAWPVLMPHFPALAKAPVYRKGALSFRNLPDAPRADACATGDPVDPPDLLVLPRYVANASPKAVRLTPIETLLELSRAGMWLSPEHADLLIDWACTCPAVALRHDGRVEVVEDLLTQALEGTLPPPDL